MKRIKVLLDFIELSIAEQIPFYRNVIAKIRANPRPFANPDETMDTVEGVVDTLEEKYIAAEDGGHATTVALHTAENNAKTKFRILAAYVDRVANGDENLILLAGFNASKQPAPIQKATLAVEDGPNSGSVKLIAKAIAGAKSYIWQYAKDTRPTEESGWLLIGYSTRADYELSGLTLAGKYYFRVAAITIEGTTDFTAAVFKVVV